jgi:large conductance mechanosensitive channel
VTQIWKEFKSFAIKGNAVDLAVGVVIGTAFGAIVNSLVKDVIMPPLSVIAGGLDFTNKFIVLKAGKDGSLDFNTPAAALQAGAITWNYGNFITLVLNFIIVAFCIFLVVRGLNKLKRPQPNVAPTARDCPFCSMTVPVKAIRCPHCTSDISPKTAA